MSKEHQKNSSVLIKRYAGRRLYNTASLAYLSLDDLANMLLSGQRFVVVESETGNDITRAILDRLH